MTVARQEVETREFSINDLEKHLQVQEAALNEQSKIIGLFKLRTANEWLEFAKNKPIPKMLFDKFWYEGEVCILFADTNVGKSILAVQIADSISRGIGIKGFSLEAEPQVVIYFDFELSSMQFLNRYSVDYQVPYEFSTANFIRSEISLDCEIPEEFSSFEDYLIHSIEEAVKEVEATAIIIDNITYLKDEMERAKNALPLMKKLKSLKEKYNLSILVIAHTPKRSLSSAITKNDLAGSKMLINFCDSSFAIGENYEDKGIKYLKQIKARTTEIVYDKNNVCICEIEKSDSFLRFKFLKYGKETDQLAHYSDDMLAEKIQGFVDSDPVISNREIGRRLGICHKKVKKLMDKYDITKLG